MSRWLDRPGYVAVFAFVGGAIVAGVVLFLVLRGGGDDGDRRGGATTPRPTLGGTPTDVGIAPLSGTATPSPGPSPTATPAGLRDPDEALDAFIRDELESEHIGGCPQELAPGGEPPRGICSAELYRSEELVTFNLGVPFSEFFGEAVLTRNEDGTWAVDFVRAPQIGEFDISVGSEAVVYLAGDCLNFREGPSISGAVVFCLLDGTRARVVEGPVDAGGITWWRLEGLGWASGQYLAPAAE